MAQRPNILLIFADQLAWRALPAYGDTFAQTPNIDRIAQRAVRFTECYTPCPLCQPARAAYWTGLHPHETGVLSNGRKHYVPPVPETVPTVGEALRKAGYATFHFGKQHDAGSLRGFHVEPMDILPVDARPAWPINNDTRQDRDTTVKTVEWLRSYDGDAPYLTIADLQNPHNICGWVGENAGAHEDVPIDGPLPPLPSNFEDQDLAKRPLPIQYICCSHRRLAQAGPWTERNYRHYLAAYYHYLARVDAEVGLILDALETRSDAGDTAIIFAADHGDGMASHRMVTKQVSFIEETTHVPLLIAGPPDLVPSDRDEATLTSLLDLAPTLCDLAGVQQWGSEQSVSSLWGHSLVPWLQNSAVDGGHAYVASEWHTEWGFTISPGRMIRTPSYKYTRYLEGNGEELYDIASDRGETETLISDPDHAPALEEHRQLLDEHLEATEDPFYSLSWNAASRWRSHPVGYQNHRGPSAPEVG
jgi:choline-sulfatase